MNIVKRSLHQIHFFSRSLLQNFQNLSMQEQTDMIAYMRRLEVGGRILIKMGF